MFRLGGFALHPRGISPQKRIVTEVINGADLRFFVADPDETITVEIPLLRFTHGISTLHKFLMGTFGPITWIRLDSRIVRPIMPILRRIYPRVFFARFLDGRWTVDAATGSMRHNAGDKASPRIVPSSLQDARCFRPGVFPIRSQKFMYSETIPAFRADHGGVDRPVEIAHFHNRSLRSSRRFANGEERRKNALAKTRAV